jgi:membrane protein YdbS with pleckstrin-like domain
MENTADAPQRLTDSDSDDPDRRQNRLVEARQRLRTSGDEKEVNLWSGTFSAKAMISYGAFVAIVTVALLATLVVIQVDTRSWLAAGGVIVLLWLALLGWIAFRKLDVHYELTSQRLVHRVGILRRTTNRIEVIDIDDVTYTQGIIERMVGVGNITLQSSDRTSPSIIMPGIDNVQEVAQLIDEARRSERVRRGLHIEAV